MADPEFEREALQYIDALYNLAMYLTRKPVEAEDLVQETYLRAFRFSNRFEPGTHQKAWLFQILRNLFLTFYRYREREPVVTDPDHPEGGEVPAFQNAPAWDANSTEVQVDLERALMQLSEEFRTIVLLAEVEGLALEDVAQVMNCPVGTVKSRLFRAKARLRRCLPDYQGDFKR